MTASRSWHVLHGEGTDCGPLSWGIPGGLGIMDWWGGGCTPGPLVLRKESPGFLGRVAALQVPLG